LPGEVQSAYRLVAVTQEMSLVTLDLSGNSVGSVGSVIVLVRCCLGAAFS
jgi:hypothetical protein